MASKPKRKDVSVTSVPYGAGGGDHTVSVLHEGWCTKESGSSFLGKTNWRKRWFRLAQKRRDVLLEYYKGKHDRNPAGSVNLDATYCTRQLESHEKPYPNCFAVGPLVDNGASRTYYISCPTMLAVQEWMTVIDAAIQGVPEQAQRRLRAVTNHFSVRQKARSKDRKIERSVSTQSTGACLESLGERGLDLTSSGEDADREMGRVTNSLERDELSDEEVLENAEDDLSDDEDDDDQKDGAVGGARQSGRRRYACPESNLSPSARLRLYDNSCWRMEHWRELCVLTKSIKWSKLDTKDGVTVGRCKFGRSSNGYAVIKVEGVLPSDPGTVYHFLNISTKQGGKLDYFFRNETLLDDIDEEPKSTIIFNQFLLPLPRVSTRDVVAMKTWIPQYLTSDESCGMVMYSVDHPRAPPTEKDSRKINISTSGIVLKVYPGPDGTVHTHATILVRVALHGALHRMLKGAYNSGLLKLGMRTTFTHMQEQLERFTSLTGI